MKRCFWTAVLCPVGCLALAQTDGFPVFSDETAREYLQATSSQFLQEAGTNSQTSLLVARLQNELGAKREAERLGKLSLSLDPGRAEAYQFLAGLWIREDRLEEASEALRQAVQLDPTIAPGFCQLGMVLDRLGNRTGARKAYSESIRVNPTNATSRLLLGRLALEEGALDEAVLHLSAACRLDPGSPNPFYALFQARQKMGDEVSADRALQQFQRLKKAEEADTDARNASASNSNNLRSITASFHIASAVVFGRQGKEGLAISHLRQAVGVEPQNPKGYELLAEAYLAKEQWAEARPIMERLTRLRPEQATYGVNLGTLLIRLKDGPGAVNEFKRVLTLNPREPAALNNLARYYLGSQKELSEALELCQRLVGAQPSAANYDLLAWALYANQRTGEAVKACKEAVQREPENAGFRDHYQRILQRAGAKE